MSRVLIGESKAMKDLVGMIHKVAASKTNILILGESGTGKELVARMIHESGPLKSNPFIPVNCGAIPENLIESEMFGHHRGSFTGAVSDKQGLFEAANKGTLFLDEVGELPLALQVKLLRAIQERVFRKVGGVNDVKVDVRIIAATNRDLEAGIQAGTFREDLYYRLNVITIRTPPLRDRAGDIRILSEAFLKKFTTKMGRTGVTAFHPDALAALEGFNWPGNVRELENVIERAITLETGTAIEMHSLPAFLQVGAVRRPGPQEELKIPGPDFSRKQDLDQILASVEKIYIQAAVTGAGGPNKKAADSLGITLRSLKYRMTKLGLGEF